MVYAATVAPEDARDACSANPNCTAWVRYVGSPDQGLYCTGGIAWVQPYVNASVYLKLPGYPAPPGYISIPDAFPVPEAGQNMVYAATVAPEDARDACSANPNCTAWVRYVGSPDQGLYCTGGIAWVQPYVNASVYLKKNPGLGLQEDRLQRGMISGGQAGARCVDTWPSAAASVTCDALFRDHCPRPSAWCRGSTEIYRAEDCTGDGVPEHVCYDLAGRRGTIRRSSSGTCVDSWPAVPYLMPASVCPAVFNPSHPTCSAAFTSPSTIGHMASGYLNNFDCDGAHDLSTQGSGWHEAGLGYGTGTDLLIRKSAAAASTTTTLTQPACSASPTWSAPDTSFASNAAACTTSSTFTATG
ncbi:hypothetical protein HXX76_005310 [Chlamydomonas incerta]|uniref:Uncharacterized protein n=1 Tax=Chlamydomonas incerta TaxID=51695 RepID=A0A835T987_CHLIN|nr:hypothetical protein HXX76_005310 [Chlamydomonas incerta]|eukprot:KAG2438768.1 hypothetical protein HXX76_005310 [Chlamydomonas incerta]